jgi:hypothetical protein
MRQAKIIAWASAFAAAGGIASISEACSVCLTGAEDASAEAINASVVFLMATPYLVVGSILGGLFYTYRRAAAKRDKVESEQPAIPSAWSEKESGR